MSSLFVCLFVCLFSLTFPPCYITHRNHVLFLISCAVSISINSSSVRVIIKCLHTFIPDLLLYCYVYRIEFKDVLYIDYILLCTVLAYCTLFRSYNKYSLLIKRTNHLFLFCLLSVWLCAACVSVCLALPVCVACNNRCSCCPVWSVARRVHVIPSLSIIIILTL